MASITSWKWARVGVCSYQSHWQGMALMWEKRRGSANHAAILGSQKGGQLDKFFTWARNKSKRRRHAGLEHATSKRRNGQQATRARQGSRPGQVSRATRGKEEISLAFVAHAGKGEWPIAIRKMERRLGRDLAREGRQARGRGRGPHAGEKQKQARPGARGPCGRGKKTQQVGARDEGQRARGIGARAGGQQQAWACAGLAVGPLLLGLLRPGPLTCL